MSNINQLRIFASKLKKVAREDYNPDKIKETSQHPCSYCDFSTMSGKLLLNHIHSKHPNKIEKEQTSQNKRLTREEEKAKAREQRLKEREERTKNRDEVSGEIKSEAYYNLKNKLNKIAAEYGFSDADKSGQMDNFGNIIESPPPPADAPASTTGTAKKTILKKVPKEKKDLSKTLNIATPNTNDTVIEEVYLQEDPSKQTF